MAMAPMAKTAPDHQPDQHSHRLLHLIHIVGQPGDQRRGAEFIHLGVGKRIDMVEQPVPQLGAKALGQ